MSDYPIFEEGTALVGQDSNAVDLLRMPEEEMVELTIRVPEQFFTQKFERSYWEGATDPTNEYPIGDYFDSWMSDIDPEMELYGPDGQQMPLW